MECDFFAVYPSSLAMDREEKSAIPSLVERKNANGDMCNRYRGNVCLPDASFAGHMAGAGYGCVGDCPLLLAGGNRRRQYATERVSIAFRNKQLSGNPLIVPDTRDTSCPYDDCGLCTILSKDDITTDHVAPPLILDYYPGRPV